MCSTCDGGGNFISCVDIDIDLAKTCSMTHTHHLHIDDAT